MCLTDKGTLWNLLMAVVTAFPGSSDTSAGSIALFKCAKQAGSSACISIVTHLL